MFISLLLLGAVQSEMSCCDLVKPCKTEIITFRPLMPIEQLANPRGTHEGAFADRYRRHFLMSRPCVAVDSALGVHKSMSDGEMGFEHRAQMECLTWEDHKRHSETRSYPPVRLVLRTFSPGHC